MWLAGLVIAVRAWVADAREEVSIANGFVNIEEKVSTLGPIYLEFSIDADGTRGPSQQIVVIQDEAIAYVIMPVACGVVATLIAFLAAGTLRVIERRLATRATGAHRTTEHPG